MDDAQLDSVGLGLERRSRQTFGYELVTGETEQDVLSRTGTAVVWTADQNPELGRFFLPAVGGEDPVVVTLTDGHLPSKQYWAQLTAIDTANRRGLSNVVAARTADPPSHSAVVFSEDDVGYSMPADYLVLSDRYPYEGTYHYDFVQTCTGGDSACWDNIGRAGLSIDPFDISIGTLSTTAFLEFALAADGPAISYWSHVRLRFGSPESKYFYYPAWTLRSDGSYHMYQIPLRAFLNDSGNLPHSELEYGLRQFDMGGLFTDGAHTSIDEVRVRW